MFWLIDIYFLYVKQILQNIFQNILRVEGVLENTKWNLMLKLIDIKECLILIIPCAQNYSSHQNLYSYYIAYLHQQNRSPFENGKIQLNKIISFRGKQKTNQTTSWECFKRGTIKFSSSIWWVLFNPRVMHQFLTKQTSEILVNKLYTALFLIWQNIITFIHSNVKVIIQL